MTKKQYIAANKRILVLSHKEDKTQEEISEAIDLATKVQQYELKKKRKLR